MSQPGGSLRDPSDWVLSDWVPEDVIALAEDPPPGLRLAYDAPLGALTTYRVGGSAHLLAEIDTELALDSLVAALGSGGGPRPVTVVGRGSNLLVADSGYDGLVIVLGGDFELVAIEGHSVIAGAAVALPALARQTVAAGLTGFEWAVGVPGSVGGAVAMNAGGHGSDMAACVGSAEVFDLATGARSTRSCVELDFGYRRSSISGGDLVLAATLGLAGGQRSQGERSLAEIVRWRRENQPGGQNAGSVFTNPPGDSAGRLLDAAGAKGMRVGSAEVSDRHANFIQVDPGGSAADVRELMAAAADLVRLRFGIELTPETRMIGFSAPAMLGEDHVRDD